MEKPIHEEKSYRLLFPARFTIYEHKIKTSYLFASHTVKISDIRAIRIVDSIPWYVGWGVRLGFGRALYFAIHHGKSVEIEKKSGFWRKVVYSVEDPEKFVSVVKKLR